MMRHPRRETPYLAGLGLAFALSLACSAPEVSTEVEGPEIRVEVRTDPPAPRSGENRLDIRVLDAAGNPLPDAELDVKITMAAMGAMPAMGGPVRITPMGDGRHRGEFDLQMDGKWRVDLRVRDAQGVLEATGSLTTGQDGLKLSARNVPAETRSEATSAPGEVQLDPARRQKVGVRTAPVELEPFVWEIRAVGVVGYDEGAWVDVAPRVTGYVEEVRVASIGEAVQRGDILFTLYSPDLLAAQKEYLTALGSTRATGTGTTPLVRAAEGRLRLWGLAASDIERLATSGVAMAQVAFRAPESGVVIEKNVVAGSATQAGERLFRIAALDRVWIEAELYESDLQFVESGTTARVSFSYLPGQQFDGTVSLVSASLDATTRTARARIVLENPQRTLLPGMYATVALRRDLGARLVVPASAVLYAGDRRFVFVDAGDGRLRPRAIETGLRSGERLEVLAGLEAGERIVVSGNYLIASESRLGSALEQW